MKIRVRKRRPRVPKPKEGPLSSRRLLELSLFSGFIFVFSALLMQVLLCLHTMLLLKHYNINFRYSLFRIEFLSQSSTKWSEEMIYLVFGSGPLLLSAAGVILLLVIKNLKKADWKTKLYLTWMAFLFVNALPCGIIAGALFFDGFGQAFFWIVSSFALRGILALVVLVLLVLTARIWYRLFLKTAYTKVLIDKEESQRIFVRSVFLKPWFFGTLILMAFNWPFHNWYWPAFLFSLGYMAIIFVGGPPMQSKPMIRKSDKMIFSSRIQIVVLSVALLLTWAAGTFKTNF